MPLDYRRLMDSPPVDVRQDITAKDTILYALGVGCTDLPHVYEAQLRMLPTMVAVLASPGFFLAEPQYAIDWRNVLHGEQSIQIHRTLPSYGTFLSTTCIKEIYDKGAAKGAVLWTERKIRTADCTDVVATVRSALFLRGDGGFGDGGGIPPSPFPVPTGRKADVELDLPTSASQALLYRLSGDDNPLHIDPAAARAVGFNRPILHGLCTYGIVGRALVEALCVGEGSRLRRMDARFVIPVYPGETIRTTIWREGNGRASFRASVLERDVVVLEHGRADFL